MTKLILGSAIVLGLPGNAFANGDHAGNGWHVVGHMLSEPDHLALLSLVALAVVFAIRKYRSQV